MTRHVLTFCTKHTLADGYADEDRVGQLAIMAKSLRVIDPAPQLAVFTDTVCWGALGNAVPDAWIHPIQNAGNGNFWADTVVTISHNAATLSEGDQVFMVDIDCIVQADIFDAFEDESFDVGLTTRHYRYPQPINAGVWCFRVNKRSLLFLGRFAAEMQGSAWATDQLALCSVYEAAAHQLPCCVKDIGWRYNYCPPSDKEWLGPVRAAEEYRRAFNDPAYKVLHFKGREMKPVMTELGRQL